MDWQLDWQLFSSKINWIYLTHPLFARLRHTLGIPAVPTVDLRFWIYRTLSFLIFWGHFHDFGRYCVLLTKNIYIVFSTRMACRMTPRSPLISWTLWIIQSLLYCIVLLCLFLPESQTWMTSEGLNLQLLSMHFLIEIFIIMYKNQWPCRTSSLSTGQNLTSNASFLCAFLHCSSVFDNQRKYSVLCLVYYFSVLEY